MSIARADRCVPVRPTPSGVVRSAVPVPCRLAAARCPALPDGPGRRAIAWLRLALLGAALAGCSPAYDWREVRADAEGVRVLLPGRPSEMARTIDLDGLRVTMTMRGAQAQGTTFAVGVVGLPDDSPATRERVVAALRAGMLRNIGGQEAGDADPGDAPRKPATVPVIDASGREITRQPAVELQASGHVQGDPATLHARFAARGARAWQWIVVGPRVDAEQAATFLDSARIVE